MTQLRTARQVRRIGDELAEPLGVGVVISIILAGLVIGIAAMCVSQHSSDFNTARANRVTLNKALSANHSSAFLENKATTLLQLRKEGLIDTLDKSYYGSLKTRDIVHAVQKVAKTGTPLQLDNHRYSWHYFRDILWITLMSMLFVWSMVGFIAYCFICMPDWRTHYYLLDLPWKHVWPALFIALTPVGWPAYLVSMSRLRRTLAQANGERPTEPARLAYHDDYFDDYLYRRQRAYELYDDEPASIQKPAFKSDPEAARIMYLALRERTWRESFIGKLESLKQRVTELTDDLRKLSDKIRRKQQERNAAAAELKQLEAVDIDTLENPDRAHIEAEFDRLLALPGVADVRTENGEIILLLEARLDYHGQRYDLGDWELRFGAGARLSTHELRSGVKRSWTGSYPVYRLGRGTFCFGHRDTTIQENLMRAQYLEAIELAVNSMQSVNHDDRRNIPSAFKKEVLAT